MSKPGLIWMRHNGLEFNKQLFNLVWMHMYNNDEMDDESFDYTGSNQRNNHYSGLRERLERDEKTMGCMVETAKWLYELGCPIDEDRVSALLPEVWARYVSVLKRGQQ